MSFKSGVKAYIIANIPSIALCCRIALTQYEYVQYCYRPLLMTLLKDRFRLALCLETTSTYRTFSGQM